MNERFIKRFIKTEILFFQSIDYYEFPGNYFSSKDLRSIYYYYLNNIILFIKKNNIKSIFFTHTPHTLVEILFLSIAKDLKIKTIFRRGLAIPDFHTYESDIFDFKFKYNRKWNYKKNDKNIEYFVKKYNKRFNTIDAPKSKWLDYSLIKYYQISKNFNIIIFVLFEIIFRLRFIYRILGVSLKSLIYLIFSFKQKNLFSDYFFLKSFLPKSKDIFYYSKNSRLYFERIIYNGHKKKNYLLKNYFKLAKKVDIEKEYIFFPLWFQPSATLHPFAGRMVDYEIAIKMLSKNCPKNFKIFVRESPDVFNLASRSWFKGHFARREKFYREISSLSNVELVNYETDDSTLVDNSVALATLCDKYNLIAIIRKKPNICFTETITSGLKNSLICKNKKDIKQFFKKLNKGEFKVKNFEVANFFKWLSENSFFSKHNLGFNKYEPKQNFAKTTYLLDRIITKVLN